MDTKIIFIGGSWEPDIDEEIIKNSKGAVQNAANIFQRNLIKGLDRYSVDGVTIMSALFIGAYPFNYKKIDIRKGYFNHLENNSNHKDYYIPFENLPVIKHFSRVVGYKRALKKELQKNKNHTTYVIGYSMTYSTIKALLYAKKKGRNVKTCIIVPDLPEYMNLGKQGLKDVVKKYVNNILYSDMTRIDSYVFLTKYMAEKVDVGRKPWCVVEGIASESYMETDVNNDSIRKIVYTGTLDAKYGICDLVDAFHSIDNTNIKLIICGYGDSESYIKEMALQDDRINFLGSVNNAEARKQQRAAYLLVNPRSSKEEYTKYSFPSKTLEYMLSGRPVMTYKLKGIPDEYDHYLYYVQDILKSSLERILEADSFELSKKGMAARDFVLREKNCYTQTDNIYTLLHSMEDSTC